MIINHSSFFLYITLGPIGEKKSFMSLGLIFSQVGILFELRVSALHLTMRLLLILVALRGCGFIMQWRVHGLRRHLHAHHAISFTRNT